jgi:hypothetical protein
MRHWEYARHVFQKQVLFEQVLEADKCSRIISFLSTDLLAVLDSNSSDA